jgi:hypothetical protein
MRTTLKWLTIFVVPVLCLLFLPHTALAHNLAMQMAGPAAMIGAGVLGFVGMTRTTERQKVDEYFRAYRKGQRPGRPMTAPRYGVMKYPTRASSYQALFNNANVTNASVPEAIPWIYFDQQNFATLWTSINFFGAAQNDLTLGNIEQPNTIAGEKYFMLYAITADFQMGASNVSNSSTAPQFDDARIIMETSRATLSLTLADKLIFRIPLAACHAIGGYQAWIAGSNFSGSTIFNAVQNMASDGAWWCDGAIILPPRQSFQFNVAGVASALSATRAIRLSLHGVLYRPVR